MSRKIKSNSPNKDTSGFSLIELLLVVTIVGIISAIAIPYFVRAVGASENGNAFASLKVISSTQVAFFTRHNRYGRLDEINTEYGDNLGTLDGSVLRRRSFSFTMSPANPTDADLRNDYLIIATKEQTRHDAPCVMTLNSTGRVTEIFGTNCIEAQ